MEGFEPITKIFLEDVAKCPYRAKRIKVDRVKSTMTPGARRGIAFHRGVAKVRTGEMTITQALEWARKTCPEEDQQDVCDLIHAGYATDPVFLSDTEKKTVQVEHYFMVDKDGKKAKSKKKAMLHGYQDRVFRKDNGIWVVDDLKSDRQKYDSTNERFCYVLGVKAEHPEATEIHFARQYVRLAEYPVWKFLFHENDTAMEAVHPDNSRCWYRTGENYLVQWMRSQDKHIREMEPLPNPGPHCESYYGEPCQFLGNECPLAKDTPAVIDHVIPSIPGVVLAQNDNPAVILLRRVVEGDASLTVEEISHAQGGLVQMEGFLKGVEKGIKGWSKAHGLFTMGESTYGWFTTKESVVDKQFALTEMLREMPIEELVKAINISKTSLEKISKRKFGEFREGLLAFAITTQDGKPKFGVIRQEEE